MYTDSIVESQYEKSLKVQGIIDVWSGGGERGKVMNMEISSDNKLLYYCSKRYKTF
jgi:peroxiredoxin